MSSGIHSLTPVPPHCPTAMDLPPRDRISRRIHAELLQQGKHEACPAVCVIDDAAAADKVREQAVQVVRHPGVVARAPRIPAAVCITGQGECHNDRR